MVEKQLEEKREETKQVKVERLVGGGKWKEVERWEMTHLQLQLFVWFLRKGAQGKGGLQGKEVGWKAIPREAAHHLQSGLVLEVLLKIKTAP